MTYENGQTDRQTDTDRRDEPSRRSLRLRERMYKTAPARNKSHYEIQ